MPPVVSSQYRLDRVLDRGAMGCVWAAEHLRLEVPVAIKLLRGDKHGDAEALARFEREAKALRLVDSRHVVRLIDSGISADGRPYLAMELLGGETLERRLERCGCMALPAVARVATHVAGALSAIHDAGFVHRDIKPANVFATVSDGDAVYKVLDLGTATPLKPVSRGGPNARLTTVGHLVGTPSYMSPEQLICSRDVDGGADLWALAVLVYRALCGTLPFEAVDHSALCIQLMQGQFVKPSEHRPELGDDVDAWMARALSKQPADRFQSAKEMARALSEIARRHCKQRMPSMNTSNHPDPVITVKDPSSKPTAEPYTLALYEDLYDKLSCRPPMKRNWTPFIAGGLIAAFAGAVLLFM